MKFPGTELLLFDFDIIFVGRSKLYGHLLVTFQTLAAYTLDDYKKKKKNALTIIYLYGT